MVNLVPPCLQDEEFDILLHRLKQNRVSSGQNQLAEWLYERCESIRYPGGTEALIESILQIIHKNDDSSSQSYLFELLGDNDGAMALLIDVMERHSQLKQLSIKEAIQATKQTSSFSSKPTPAPSSKSSKSTSLNNSMDWLLESGFSEAYLHQERLLGLQKNRVASIDTWKDNLAPEGTLEYHEKINLTAGSDRKHGVGYEEVFIPAPPRLPKPQNSELVDISTLESWAQLAFEGTKYLNRIQSIVYPSAYNSAENILVCAPTGAGKTNIAMLTFLQLVKQHIFDGRLDKEAVKAIYIAPMKALAQEVVAKFSERLAKLGFVVKEFTGDMQLTKAEIEASNLIVTTPEKWDVVTRKGGEGSLGTLVSLIIIDEVHLLADERGAVIETIVARTQRYVESSQSMVRLVGLSATLPNYKDVAVFLNVNLKTGLHFFGPEFRPVPLDQTIIGVTEKSRAKKNDLMNKIAYDKMVHALERDKQIMIFVHARKETVRTATAMKDLSGKFATTGLLENIHHEQYLLWKRDVDKSKSVELQQLFACGLGVHHAGMLRSDRTLTERLFECGLIKVLVCTSTLAWGVNLPAHTVIIKGTELYDPERGGFVDVSVLDILQIFGRAGRPQYDSQGHAILITPHTSLNNYIALLAHQAPIESSLIKALPDHLNAEIVNGTINNLKEASMWLRYTFLFVRMRKNPLVYGMDHEECFDDPQLEKRRTELVRIAATKLDSCMMIRFDPQSGNLAVTDLGRVASHYYIRHGTIDAFNAMLASHLNESEALHVLCSAAEFDQLKVRPEELTEIDQLKRHVSVKVRGPVEDTAGKVGVLLQGYIGQARINSFTLQSDSNYVAQNAGRITRALFEICLKKGWSTLAHHYLSLCKSIDRRMQMDQNPLRQFYELPYEAITHLENINAKVSMLLDMDAKEIGSLCHNQKAGQKMLEHLRMLPSLTIDAFVQPLTRGVLRMVLDIKATFNWHDRYHGTAEPFWIWVEDGESEYVYHYEYILVQKKQRNEVHNLEFVIPIRDPMPPQYYVRYISDRWVGCEDVITVSFQHLILPDRYPPHTELLDVHPVPKSALQNPLYESMYKFSHFNPIQSQTFHALYHSDVNILVGAPTGSGKTITSELALLRLFSQRSGAKAVYIAPLKALARERLEDWRRKLGGLLGMSVVEMTGDVTPDLAILKKADVIITTPEKWDGITRGWKGRAYVQNVELLIIDEIHLLGEDRGPVLEVIVSRMRFIASQTAKPVRFIGLSTALANSRDLADWLGIGQIGIYNFRPSVRPIPMSIHIQGFPGKHYCPRMATMNKPCYASIKEHSPMKPVLIFVSSRRQTRLTALDLISYCAADDNPKQFLHMPEMDIMEIADAMVDSALKDCLVFGIGIHHAGLETSDREAVERLFVEGKIQVLVCTSTLAWGVNFPAHLCIIKGTEFFDAKTRRYVDFPVTDVLQMMGRAGRPQFDDTGVSCIMVHEPKKNFYKKFLHEPFPVESSLHHQLHNHFNAEIANQCILSIGDCIEYISWTYYFRRLVMNPSYYRVLDPSEEGIREHLVSITKGVLRDLAEKNCIELSETFEITPTYLGQVASLYYIDYKTVGAFDTFARSSDAALHMKSILFTLCNAHEFSELPVRHNEENLNVSLAEALPWSKELRDFESPNVKANLLLQAHFFGVPLPISDYINDTKSVLDQVPRVMNALLDIAAHHRNMALVEKLLTLSQMIIQGSNEEASQLRQLPYITDDAISRLRQDGICTLKDLIRMSQEKLDKLIGNKLKGHKQDFWRALANTPAFELTVKTDVADKSTVLADQAHLAIPFAAFPITFEVTIRRLRGETKARVHAPKYHKAKVASYWLLIGTKAELLVCKRIESIGNSSNFKVALPAPVLEREGLQQLSIKIVSDSQLGISEQLQSQLILS